MPRAVRLILGMALAAFAAAAPAQFGAPNSDMYLESIRHAELAKMDEMTKGNPQLVNSRSTTGQTPVMLAIDERNFQILSFLLFHKADPNAADGVGELPLVAAARKGWGEGVDGLLEMGARIDGRNQQGETALMVAVQARSERVVRQLLARGANPDIADRIAGFSARDYARRDSRNPRMLQLINAVKPKP